MWCLMKDSNLHARNGAAAFEATASTKFRQSGMINGGSTRYCPEFASLRDWYIT